MRPEKLKYSTELTLWILFFCYATSAALLFQKLLLPLIPSLHAGQGLLDGDSVYFHSVAVQLAEKIRLHGWSAWSLYPAPGATGNVAILGALYAVVGDEPSLIIPINAAIHALCGVLVYQIARQLASGKTGRIAGTIAAVLFVMFPSALNWYAQIHKDGFAIAGVLCVIWAWVWVRERRVNGKAFGILIGGTLAGVLLVIFVRPYNLLPLTAVIAAVFCAIIAIDIRQLRLRWKKLTLYALSVAVITAGAAWSRTLGTEEQFNAPPDIHWHWERTGWLPQIPEDYLETVARLRVRLIASGIEVNAGSLIDRDVVPNNISSVIAYAPRAVQIALFAPFPTTWMEKISLTRLVSVFEMLIWYLIAPGVLLAIIYRRSSRLMMVLIFSALFLYIYGFTIANVGTLYRVRYPYLFIFIIVGLVGWVELYLRHRGRARAPPAPIENPAPVPGDEQTVGAAAVTHARLFGAGIIVTALTGLTYAGLFLRDVIIARWFGVGADLDAFFIASAIPMFIVAVLSAPLGTMIIPQFLSVRATRSDAVAQQMVSGMLMIYTAFTIFVALGLGLAAPSLLQLIANNFPADKIQLAQSLLILMLPIMIISGVVIVGNAMLNALHNFAVPAAAQLVVPVMSIAALGIFGNRYGIASVIIGMLAGQLINLAIVVNALAKNGFSVRPRWTQGAYLPASVLAQYLPLVTAALLVNLAVPINMAMASTLIEGSIAALGLGNKIVIVITGLVGATMATIILPHFASYMARSRLLDARKELSFLLLAASVLMIPVALILFESADVIVRLAFGGGAMGDNELDVVARVTRFGILQLPFFTANLLILKFAIATRHAGRVMIASLFGVAANAALNLVLMGHSGVAGIALAASIAVALSAGLMLILFNRLGHISWVDLIMVALNWMLYTTLVICLQYGSYTGVAVTVFALASLLYGQWSILVRWRVAA